MKALDDNRVIENTIAMISYLDEPWGIKDIYSNHVYMNKAGRSYTNTPNNFTVEGKHDREFPTEWSELADDLQEHDKITAARFCRVAVIETHYWNGNDTIMPYVSEKIPIFDHHGCCVGTLWNAKEVKIHSPLIYINQKKTTILTTEPSLELFKEKELHVIFLLLQNFSCKEMARVLNISPRTVECRLGVLFQKTNVHSMRQLKEYCTGIGLENYIPETLLLKGVQFI